MQKFTKHLCWQSRDQGNQEIKEEFQLINETSDHGGIPSYKILGQTI